MRSLYYFLNILTSFSLLAIDITNKANTYEKFDNGEAIDLLGLSLSKLMKENQIDSIKEQLLLALNNNNDPKDFIYLWLLKVAAIQKNDTAYRNYLSKINTDFLLNNHIIYKLYYLSSEQQKNILITSLLKYKFWQKKYISKCPYYEIPERLNRAKLLYDIIKNHKLPSKISREILQELFIHIPEAISLDNLNTIKEFLSWKVTEEDIAKRMDNLLIFGQNLEAKKSKIFYLNKKKKSSCLIDYIEAKADKNLKNYTLARNTFKKLAKLCGDDIKIKARYMELILASKLNDISYLNEFDKFVEDYKDHGFADDILFLKANMLLSSGKTQEALLSLGKIINNYPQGDMISKAYFLQGFIWAQNDDITKAISSFSQERKINKPNSISYAQGAYWEARLKIAPKLDHINNIHKNQDAIYLLKELTNAQNPTIYSWLAQLLLEKLHIFPDKNITHDEIVLSSNNHQLKIIKNAIKYGFREDALDLIKELANLNHNELQEVAVYYKILNRSSYGHQKLIRCGEVSLPKIANIMHEISYPKPYDNEVDMAFSKFNVEKELIYAVMRQESGFIENACSWAQAKGLMQLMYPSALEQAKTLGINELDEENLYDPKINILLASSLLKKYRQQFPNILFTLSAYNAGPKNASSWYKKYKDHPADVIMESIPFKDTKEYIKSVLGSTLAYLRLTNNISAIKTMLKL